MAGAASSEEHKTLLEILNVMKGSLGGVGQSNNSNNNEAARRLAGASLRFRSDNKKVDGAVGKIGELGSKAAATADQLHVLRGSVEDSSSSFDRLTGAIGGTIGKFGAANTELSTISFGSKFKEIVLSVITK